MSTPYENPPSAIVQQEFAALPTGVIQDQTAVIIGPNKLVRSVTDSADRNYIVYGAYIPGADTDYGYAGLPVGGVVELSSVSLQLENILARYADLSGTGDVERGAAANEVEIPTALGFQAYNNGTTAFLRNAAFVNRDVKIGDYLKITPVANPSAVLTARITGFSNATVAANVSNPTSSTNPSTQAYSGTPANTNVEGTDHLATVFTGNTTYKGNIPKGVINDVYVLECTTAGSVGIKQVETATVVGSIGVAGAGTMTLTITSADIDDGTPLVVTTATIANSASGTTIATAIRTAMNLVSAITDIFTITTSTDTVIATRKTPADNDSTLNMAIGLGTATGPTAAPISVATTAGVAGTAAFKVTSTNGDNVASVSFENVAFGQAFDVGTRGLQAKIASSGSEDFIVGEQYTFTMVAGYTNGAPTLMSGATVYDGAFDTTYKIKVVKGGLWTENPQVIVTTSTGIDQSGPIVVADNTSFAIGQLGLLVKFGSSYSSTQNGLVYGDEYFVTAAASKKGAVRTARLSKPIDAVVVEGDELDVEFFIHKNSMTIPNAGYPEFSSVALTAAADKFTVAADIYIKDSTWTEVDAVTPDPIPVITATVVVPYRALLTASSNILQTLSSLSVVSSVLNRNVPENPLAYGVGKALENSGGQPVNFIAVESDDLAGYAAALEILEITPTPYFRVFLTQDATTLDLLKAHVLSEASDDKGNRCVGVVAQPLNPISIKYSLKENGDNWTGYVAVEPGSSPAIYTRVTVPDATFVTDGIRPRDEFRSDFDLDALGNPTYVAVKINEVVDEENLVLVTPGFSTAIGNSGSLQRIQVVRNLTKDEQAIDMAGLSSEFKTRRVYNVFSDFPIEVSDVFSAAALAGLASSVVPHQPITNYTVGGFNDQAGTRKRFTPTQLNTMAGGGTLILTKNAQTGNIFVRHQLSTDNTDDLQSELSVCRNVDSISSYLLQGLKVFVARYNITDNFLQLLDVQLRQRLNNLQANTSTPSAGPQIAEWDPASLKIVQDPVSRTVVDIVVDVKVPMPANTLRLKLRVSA